MNLNQLKASKIMEKPFKVINFLGTDEDVDAKEAAIRAHFLKKVLAGTAILKGMASIRLMWQQRKKNKPTS